MIKKLIVFASLCFCWLINPAWAQEEVDTLQKESDTIIMIVEEMPEFPSGQEGLNQYLLRHISYPKEERKAGIQGMVLVNFIIEKDGSVSNARIVKSVSPGIDEEALKIVRNMPKWSPGKQRGKFVRVSMNLPLRFSLK